MKKKSILMAAIAVMLVAVLVVGGTLAYFTDTKSATNTFTVGNVKITLNELQRGENGLEPFKQNKVLYPIVGSAQGDKDEYGLPVAKNYCDKIISVTNTGSSDAYVRAYFALPTLLDDGDPEFNASKNILHFNFGNVKVGDSWRSTDGVEWSWQTNGQWKFFTTAMKDGIQYNVYYADYYQKLAPGATTEDFVQGVYLDKNFNYDAGTTSFKGVDLTNISCPVAAIAVQAEGFDNATAAIDAAFGADFNPFANK